MAVPKAGRAQIRAFLTRIVLQGPGVSVITHGLDRDAVRKPGSGSAGVAQG